MTPVDEIAGRAGSAARALGAELAATMSVHEFEAALPIATWRRRRTVRTRVMLACAAIVMVLLTLAVVRLVRHDSQRIAPITPAYPTQSTQPIRPAVTDASPASA